MGRDARVRPTVFVLRTLHLEQGGHGRVLAGSVARGFVLHVVLAHGEFLRSLQGWPGVPCARSTPTVIHSHGL